MIDVIWEVKIEPWYLTFCGTYEDNIKYKYFSLKIHADEYASRFQKPYVKVTQRNLYREQWHSKG